MFYPMSFSCMMSFLPQDYYDLHFADEETEVQGGELASTCRSQDWTHILRGPGSGASPDGARGSTSGFWRGDSSRNDNHRHLFSVSSPTRAHQALGDKAGFLFPFCR